MLPLGRDDHPHFAQERERQRERERERERESLLVLCTDRPNKRLISVLCSNRPIGFASPFSILLCLCTSPMLS